jgi:hypothetical protein
VEEIKDDEIPGFAVIVNGRLVESKFDLSIILKNRKAFVDYLNERVGIPAEPTFAAFNNWAATLASLDPKESASYWLVLGKICINLDKLVYRVLSVASETAVTVGQILASVPASLRDRLLRYFKELEENGFISFKSGDHVIKTVVKADPSVVAYRTKRTQARPYGRVETLSEEKVRVAKA